MLYEYKVRSILSLDAWGTTTTYGYYYMISYSPAVDHGRRRYMADVSCILHCPGWRRPRAEAEEDHLDAATSITNVLIDSSWCGCILDIPGRYSRSYMLCELIIDFPIDTQILGTLRNMCITSSWKCPPIVGLVSILPALRTSKSSKTSTSRDMASSI